MRRTALYTSARPPAKTPYSLYTRGGDAPSASTSSVLAAETDAIEYNSRNQLGLDRDGEEAGHAVQCVLSLVGSEGRLATDSLSRLLATGT
jgi:hypothetical protein